MLSGIGSHFPRSVPAEKGPFQVLELDVLLAVVVVGRDDDLVPPCAVSSLLRHVSVMTSETLARAGTLGGLVVLEARMGRGEEVWRAAGVHSTDINPVPALHTGEKPQYSNDFRWVLRRQTR